MNPSVRERFQIAAGEDPSLEEAVYAQNFVDPDLAIAVMAQESAFKPRAGSSAGAQGYMQVMPANAEHFAPGEDIYRTGTNIKVGTQLLREELDRFNGDEALALAAYNAGSPKIRKAIERAGSTKFEDLIPVLEEMGLHETVDYVPKVLGNYGALKDGQREENVAKREQSYLDPWGTTEEFATAVHDMATDPGFDKLPVKQQIQKLDTLYNSKKWADETQPILASVADAIWEGAPDEAPKWQEMIGYAVEGDTPEAIAKSAEEHKEIIKAGLREKGVEPALFGSQIDKYFDSISREEQARAEVRNRGMLGTAVAAGEEVARGLMQGVAGPIAAIPTLAGYEETGKAIREYPAQLIPENRDFSNETDERGAIRYDSNGQPLTKMRGAVLQGIGQVGSLLLGGAALKTAGYSMKGIATFFGGTNTLGSMDDHYAEARDEGATRYESLLASAAAIPGAVIDTVVDASIFGSGQFWMKGLTGANKARAVAQSMLSAAVKEGSVEALQEDLQQRAVGSITGKEYSPERTLTAGVAGAVAGGLLGGYEGYRYKAPPLPAFRDPGAPLPEAPNDPGAPFPQEQLRLPAPEAQRGEEPGGFRLLPPAKVQQELATKFERFQQSTDKEMIIDLGANEQLPPEMLNLFAFESTRLSDGQVSVRKQSSYQAPDIDENNLDAVSDEVQTLAKEINEAPDPEDGADLVTERARLKQELQGAEKNFLESEKSEITRLVEIRRETEQQIADNRRERKRTPDKVLQQVLDKEFTQLQKTAATAERVLAKDPRKRKAVETREQLSVVNGKLKQLAPRDYFNTLKDKEARLQHLLRRRADLKEAQQGGFIHADGFKEAAIKVETPDGDKFIMPLKDSWYVLDNRGNVISEGGPLLQDALRAARTGTQRLPGKQGALPTRGKPGEGLVTKLAVPRRGVTQVNPFGGTFLGNEEGILGLSSAGAVQAGAGGEPGDEPQEREGVALSRDAFTRIRESEARKPITGEFAPEREITKTGTAMRSVIEAKKKAIAALASLKARDRKGIPNTISENGVTRPGLLGYFAFNKEYVRIKKMNDILTIAHEMAHVVDKYTFGKWDSKGHGDYDLLDPKVKEGLIQTAETFYPADIPNDIKVQEGFAMFIQHLVSGQPVHSDVLKWFRRDFAQGFPAEYKAVNAFVDAAFEYNNQTPQNFARSFRSAKPPGTLERLALGTTKNFRRDVLDYAASLVDFDRLGGTKIKDFFDSRRNKAAYYASHIMNNQIVDLNGNVLSEISLGATLKPVIDAGKGEELSDYMTAKRAVSYISAGLEPGLNMEDAGAVILDTEKNNPEIVTAAHKFWDQWTLLQEALSRDSLTAKDYFDKIREVNMKETGTPHAFYVPFEREGKGRIQLGTSRKGSYRRIADPLTKIQSVVQGLAEAVTRRNVLEQLIQSAQDPMNPSGAYVREVTSNVTKKALDTELGEKKRSVLTGEGVESVGEDLDPKSDEFLNSAVGFLDPKMNKVKASEGYVFLAVPDFTQKNKMRYFEVSEDIYRVFNNKLPEWTSSPAFKVAIQYPKEIVKAGATTLRPAFALTNLGRDLFTAYRRAQTWNPYTFGKDILQGLIESTKSAVGMKNLNNWVNFVERMGLQGSNRFNSDIQEQIETKGKSWKRHPIRKLEDIISISEKGIRTAAVIAKARELGVTPDSELSPQQAVELALAYKRGTTDFAVQGEKTRVVNMAVPFFTARIAETLQMAQDMKRRPAKVAALGTAWATFGMMYAIAHKDDEWYKEMKADELGRFAHFPVEKDGKEMLMRVPLDSWASFWFTVGQGVAAGAGERGELHKNASAFASALVKGTLPFGTPIDNKMTFVAGTAAELGGPLFKEMMQQYANRDFFFDKPIVPKSLEQVRPEDQATEATSRSAKEVARLTGLSPVRVDHLVRSLSAVTADAVRIGENISGLKRDKDKNTALDYATGPFYRYGSANSVFDTSSEKFYDDVNKFQANKDVETAKEKSARLKLNEAKERVAAINLMLTTDVSQEERDQLLEKKRALFAEAREIAAGKTEQALSSAPKKQAERVRKERRAATAGKREERDQEIFD